MSWSDVDVGESKKWSHVFQARVPSKWKVNSLVKRDAIRIFGSTNEMTSLSAPEN